MAELLKVAETKDVPAGENTAVEVGGKKVALFNVDGNYYAVDDTCTHRGGPLSEGAVEGTRVTCPWHGATFDLTTGDASSPAPSGVSCYKVHVEGNDIKIEIP